MKEKLKKVVKKRAEALFSLLWELRMAGDWTCHPESYSEAEIIPASEREITAFVSSLLAGVKEAELVVSDLKWVRYDNCVGDELYPCVVTAKKIGEREYLLTIKRYSLEERGEITERYVWAPDEGVQELP